MAACEQMAPLSDSEGHTRDGVSDHSRSAFSTWCSRLPGDSLAHKRMSVHRAPESTRASERAEPAERKFVP